MTENKIKHKASLDQIAPFFNWQSFAFKQEAHMVSALFEECLAPSVFVFASVPRARERKGYVWDCAQTQAGAKSHLTAPLTPISETI